MERTRFRAARAVVRILLVSALTAVALAALGYWPTQIQAGSAGVGAMAVGIGVALVGSWSGTAPFLVYLRRPAREQAVGILIALAVRFAVTMGVTLAIWWADALPARPLLLWVGMTQLVLLGVDVLGLVGTLKEAAREAL